MKIKTGDDGTLFSRAGRALGWSFASTALGRLSTLAIGIALARLLGPAEFGTFSVALVALLALLSFNELGVSLAIVRWPGDPKEISPTVATISVGSSLLVSLVCLVGAGPFADAMGAPHAAPVVRVLALCVLINGLVAVPVATLQREFRQDRKMVADQVTSWLGSLTSIGCAIGGLGAMSLAIGQVVGAIGGAILFIAFAPASLRFGFDRVKAKALLKFGFPLAGSSIVVFAVGNIDKLIVGWVLGPVPLGFYVLAVNLSNWPVSVFSAPVRSVAPAALARLQGDQPTMRRVLLSTAGLLASVTVPVCVLLASASGPLVRFVYGQVWAPAAPVLVWLGLTGALRILFELFYDYFVVLANTRVVFTVQVVWFVALLPALLVGAHIGGPAGAGLAQLGVALLFVLPIYLYELRRHGIPATSVWSRLALPIGGGLVVAGTSWVAVHTISIDLVAIVVSGLVALAVMAALGYRQRHVVRELRTVEAVEHPAAAAPASPAPDQRPSTVEDVTPRSVIEAFD